MTKTPQQIIAGITQAEADAKNRAWPPFKFWLQGRSSSELFSSDAKKIAKSYAPLEAWEIESCIAMRLKTLEACNKTGREPPTII